MVKKKNPLVFFDVSIDGDPVKRMVFELFSDVAPKTAENFRALCTGEKGVGTRLGKPLHYKGTFFHRIIKGFIAQGGDFLRQEGSAGESIYGDKFPDESPKLKHDEPGLLSMTIADRDMRGSIFNLTFKPDHSLDRKNIVFGKLVHGHNVLKKIEDAGDAEGRPAVMVKIIKSGEYSESDKKKLSKKLGKEGTSDVCIRETGHKGKHKKSSRDRRKRRRKYYTSESESDSSSDSELDSTESDSSSETDTSLTEISSSSDEKRKKRKRSSKRDKHKRGKRRDRRRDKKRKRHDKHSRRKSRRTSDSLSGNDSESTTESSSEDEVNTKDLDQNHENNVQKAAENHSSMVEDETIVDNHKRSEGSDKFDNEGVRSLRKNGGQQSNGYERDTRSSRSEDRRPDVVEDHPDKSRSRSPSPKRAMSKSISPRSMSRSRSVTPRRSMSRTPSARISSPQAVQRSRSISRSPVRSVSSRSPSRSISRSPPKVRSPRDVSVSPPPRSPPRRSPTESPPRTSSRRSIGRRSSPSPVRSSRRSISRSSGRAPSRRAASRSPVRSPRRSYRRSYSRSPSRRSPPIRRRSMSRSLSPDGSPKRIRRGRGFSDRFSYARRYRTPTPERHRYGGRDRRYPDRSPRRYRSPRRSPPRYRGRRSKTRSRSASRSPPYRDRKSVV